jgi:hypothetical protein
MFNTPLSMLKEKSLAAWFECLNCTWNIVH